MTAVARTTSAFSSRTYSTAADWLRELGDIPLRRIICNPWPGTATEADLLRFVESKQLCELIDGTLVEKPMGIMEAIVAANIIGLLTQYVTSKGLGAISGPDSTLRMASTGRIRLPDVCFFSTKRLAEITQAVPTVSPELAIEVLSEGNTAEEIARKLQEYFASGTLLAWIVDPEHRTVTIYHNAGALTLCLSDTDTVDGENVLPGFTAKVSDFFQNVPTYR